MQRFYRLDGLTLTWNQFKSYFGQISRVRRWEEGQNPDDPSSMTPEQFVQAVLAGDIKPNLSQQINKKELTPQQKAIEEARVLGQLGESPSAKMNNFYGSK